MTTSTSTSALIALAIVATGIYVAHADDPSLPGLGPAGIGMLLMIGATVLVAKAARNQLPAWGARTVLAGGVLVAALAAFLTHGAAVTALLFAHPQNVPSVI